MVQTNKHTGRRFAALIVCLMALTFFVLVGCSKTQAGPVTSAEAYAAVLQEHGFKTVNQTSQIKEGQTLTSAYVSTAKNDEASKKCQVEYYTFGTDAECDEQFNKSDNELVSAYVNESGYKTENDFADDHDKRVVETDSRYYVISRQGNAMVIAFGEHDDKTVIDSIFKGLGF